MVSTRQQSAFILLVAGAVMMHFYFYNIDLNPQSLDILYGGIALQVLSVVTVSLDLLRKKDKSEISLSFYALYVFAFALSQATINLTRFSLLPGTDLLAEVNVAEQTLRLSYWDFSRVSEHRYMSSLAVTVLPTVFARFTGINDMYTVFALINTLFISLTPVLLILLVTRFFNDIRLGILSSILVVQNYFFYYTLDLIMKSTIAYVLLILSIICLTYKSRKYQFLSIVFLSALVFVHYTIGILAFIFMTTLILFRTLLTRNNLEMHRSNILYLRGLTIVGCIVAVWVVFAATSVFVSIVDVIRSVLGEVLNLASGLPLTGNMLRQGAEVGYVTSSPAGPAVTIFFEIQSGLMLLGGLFLFASVADRRYQGRRFGRFIAKIPSASDMYGYLEENTDAYVLAGLSVLCLLVAWFVLPVVSSQISIFRIANFSLIVTPFFMAVVLYRFLNSASRRFLQVFALVFLLLMLPMNMMIPNQERNVLYHPIDSLEPAKQLDVLSSQYQTGYAQQLTGWMTKHLPADADVRTDAVGRYAIKTLLPVNSTIQWTQSDTPNKWPTYNGTDRYFLVNGISIENRTWIYAKLQGRQYVYLNSPTFFGDWQNLIFNSGEFYIFQHSSEETDDSSTAAN
ncbi:MAG: DUF2206 domain-containing protein [Thaumarchaeota archaeon]|nr:DUF2206 domain-containing protein [Nitrososphaerota archaeon]MCL5317477.1 DUF2206 domain-containing protein [Nitrososphaerota archaeon]